MPVSFYILCLITVIVVPGAIFFAEWWNNKHGYDSRGRPIQRSPQPDQ